MEELQGSLRNFCSMVSLVSRDSLSIASIYLLFHSDIAYYGINLNQSIILTKIGYAKGPNAWTTLWNIAVGNIIIQSAVREVLEAFDIGQS